MTIDWITIGLLVDSVLLFAAFVCLANKRDHAAFILTLIGVLLLGTLAAIK